jgi:hypothetical protein
MFCSTLPPAMPIRLTWPLQALLPILACALPAATAHAAETGSQVPDLGPAERSTLDRSQETASDFVEAILQRADALFSGNRSYDAPTGSYLMLGGKFTFRREEDGADAQSPITRAKISLPKTERRLQLLIERDIEGTTTSDSQRDAQVAAGQATADNNPYLGLRALNAERLKLKLSADAGVRMRSPPDPFARVRAARIFNAGAWQIPVSETLLARYTEPFSATTEIGFLRGITADTAVAFTTNATWRQNLRGFDLSQTANAAWLINQRSLLALELGAYGTTQPVWQDTAYSAALRYRRKVYRDWLLAELRPQIVYSRSENFRPQPSITLQVEVYFGKNYLPRLR